MRLNCDDTGKCVTVFLKMESFSSLEFTILSIPTHLHILAHRVSREMTLENDVDLPDGDLTLAEKMLLRLGFVKEEDLKKKKVRVHSLPCCSFTDLT
jgi:hypothetical protein